VRRLRIAVVGTGFGARIHVPGLRASGRFDVVALVGRDIGRTRDVAARLAVPSAYGSVEEVCALVDLDAVAIATPPATHAALAITAARAGKHVLCEKPMARSATEARAMRDAVHEAGVVGLVDFEFRFHPGRAMLRRMIARGDLGEPQLLVVADAMPLYVAPYKTPPAWWFDTDAGGGWLGASGSHLLDATRFWLGDARSVTAMVDTLGGGSADDTYAILLRMASGARAVLQQSAAVLGPRFQALRLSGSEGTAWFDEAWVLWQAGRTGEPNRVPIADDLLAPAVELPPHGGPFAAREFPSYVRLAETFGDAILGRDSAIGMPPAPTFDDGLACQLLMDAAREASRAMAWVVMEA
jgi:predicted dehydrogenase